MSEQLPMFPLGTTVFPGAVAPLHVFEGRYRALVETCLRDSATFGIVLIRRGSEVGGGDERFEVGTRCRIAESHRFDDGRFAVLAEGVERIGIDGWLEDDPYPLASVRPISDAGNVSTDVVSGVEKQLRRSLALAAELGRSAAPATLQLPSEPGDAIDLMAAAAPILPLDAQLLLETADLGRRAAKLSELLADSIETFRLELQLE